MMINNCNDRGKSNSVFQAAWNDQLKYDDRHLSVIARKVKNFIFYIPNSILAAVFNPRPETESNHPDCKKINRNGKTYFSLEDRITTPDNVHLKVKIEADIEFKQEARTVILFNPLGTNYVFHDGLTAALVEKNCNVVRFDYRGLGTTWRAKDFVVDGDTVYQYVVDKLMINPKNICFYGTSLGGGVAAQVKSLHPESGKYAADRAFVSIFSLVTEKCCISRLGTIIKKITSVAAAIFIALPVSFLGWEWNSANADLGDQKLGVYHPNDCLVPKEASLALQFDEGQRVCLDANATGGVTHFAPIDFHQLDQSGENAIDRVVDFLAK